MNTKCNNCNGTFMYVGSVKSAYSLIIKDRIICDKNIPSITFCFVCRCCKNKIILCLDDGVIKLTQNYGTIKIHYITVYPKEKK